MRKRFYKKIQRVIKESLKKNEFRIVQQDRYSKYQEIYYRQRIWVDKGDMPAYTGLAKILLGDEQYEKAIRYLTRATDISPQHYWLYSLLTQALDGSDRTQDRNIETRISLNQSLLRKMLAATNPGFTQCEQSFGGSPNFLLIGQEKCGTTTLYAALRSHPAILPALRKEVKFWSDNYDLGIGWYRSYFPWISEDQRFITGEASVAYLNHPEIALRLKRVFPEIKLLVLLRNPVDRAVSAWHMYAARGWEERTIEDCLFDPIYQANAAKSIEGERAANENQYLKNSRYIELLREWMNVFTKDQFLVIKSEDFFCNPEEKLKEVCEFLDVEPYGFPEYRKFNSRAYQAISKETRKAMEDYFRPYNQQLEEFLNRKFDWF